MYDLFQYLQLRNLSDKLLKFDLKTNSWEEEKPGGFPPVARSFAASTVYKNSMLVFGGTGRK